MFAYLKALAARLAQRGLDAFSPPPPEDLLGVREPRKRGPGGRSAAAAVAEPREQTFVRAHGKRRIKVNR